MGRTIATASPPARSQPTDFEHAVSDAVGKLKALGADGRGEAERAPLRSPLGRQIHQPLEAKATGKTAFDRRLGERGINECERERLANGSLRTSLLEGDRSGRHLGLCDKTIEPEPGFSIGAGEGSSSLDPHGADASWRTALALNEFPSPSRRRRGPCNGDRWIAMLMGHVLV